MVQYRHLQNSHSQKLHINNNSVCVITLTTRRGRQSGPTGLTFKLIGLIRTESCPGCHEVTGPESFPCFSTDSDYENANRSADVDVELMAFQSIIGDDYKGQSLSLLK